jgi:HPt (histidine-containing phosphotransfer) domain-containing protein
MVDLQFLHAFTKGDTVKMRRYIDMYLRIAPKTFQQMAQAVRAQDWEQLRIHAHSLKPQADYMGLAELKAVLIRIEDSVNAGQFTTLKQQYDLAAKLHRQSITALKQARQTLN